VPFSGGSPQAIVRRSSRKPDADADADAEVEILRRVKRAASMNYQACW
jgi:hypothetical protein